jgi:hypothetical protein
VVFVNFSVASKSVSLDVLVGFVFQAPAGSGIGFLAS